jgi:hypothetical protein
MKYIFRGHIIFEYIPNEENRDRGTVKQHNIEGTPISGFDYCRFIGEDWKILSEFFGIVYRHTQGENVELNDIEVS